MVPSTGPVTIQDVVNEFGEVGQPSGTAPHALKEFYSAAAGIPATGELTLFDFRGASAAPPAPTVTEGRTTYTTTGKISLTYGMNGYAINAREVDTSFSTTAIGSLSPSTYNGVTIEAATLDDNFVQFTFTIILQGNRAKGFFTSVTPQGGNTLTSASSTHSYTSSGNYTKWVWFDNPGETTVLGPTIVAQWNGSGTSTVTFV